MVCKLSGSGRCGDDRFVVHCGKLRSGDSRIALINWWRFVDDAQCSDVFAIRRALGFLFDCCLLCVLLAVEFASAALSSNSRVARKLANSRKPICKPKQLKLPTNSTGELCASKVSLLELRLQARSWRAVSLRANCDCNACAAHWFCCERRLVLCAQRADARRSFCWCAIVSVVRMRETQLPTQLSAPQLDKVARQQIPQTLDSRVVRLCLMPRKLSALLD